MNESTVLGISIPTYKRPEDLRKCVHSCLQAGEAHGISITLIDDAGDDTNAALFAELQARSPLIKLHRNPQNLGIDRNIQRAVDVCDCDYVWLLGEDDRMKPEALSELLEIVTQDAYPFVYANYTPVDNNLQFQIRDRSLPLEQDQVVDADRFYREYAWSMGFIGACIIRRKDWDPHPAEPFLDSYFAHVGRIMSAIHGQSVYMIATPRVLNRCGTPEAFSWTGDAAAVFRGWRRMCEQLNELYGEEAGKESLSNFERAHGIGSLKFLGYLRADGVLNPDSVQELLTFGESSEGYLRCARWIARLPAFPWRWLRSLQMGLRQLRSPSLDLPQ